MWQERAACRDKPDWWFPSVPRRKRRRDEEDPYLLARLVCMRCPVIADCFAHVVRNVEPEGMWAGLTPNDREAAGLMRVLREDGTRSGRPQSQEEAA